MGRTSLATLLLTVLAVSRAADPRPAGECLQGELRSHSLTFPRDFFIEAPEEDRSDSVKVSTLVYGQRDEMGTRQGTCVFR